MPPVPADSSATWTWRPTLSDAERRRVRLAAAAAVTLVVALAVASIASPSRPLVVLTVIAAATVGLCWLQHRQLCSTRVTLGAGGRVTLADSRSSSSIDAAGVDTVALRRRDTSSESVLSSRSRWTIALAGPEHAISHRLAHVAGIWNLDGDALAALEADLRTQIARHRSTGSIAARSADASHDAATFDRADGSDRPDRLDWRPATNAKARRNRLLFRCAYVVPAVLIAIVGVSQEWEGTLADKVLTGATVPGFLLACGVATEHALARNRRFRLEVDHGRLTVHRAWRGPASIELEGAQLSIERRATTVSTGDGTSRAVRWYLEVERPDGVRLTQQLPSLGVIETEDGYLALERELRRHT